MSNNPTRVRLGELLVSKALVTAQDIDLALEKSKVTGRKLGRTLVEMGKLRPEDIAKAIASQLNLPYVDLKTQPIDPKTSALIPETVARRHIALALRHGPDGKPVVAMADPADVYAFDELSKILGGDFSPACAEEDEIFSAIDRIYQRAGEISDLAGALSREIEDVVDFQQVALSSAADEAPVAKLLQNIFESAISTRTSDIHIEPMEKRLLVRFRVDGALRPQLETDVKIAQACVQRLKLAANLDIAERRLPQDGRFNVSVRQQLIDVRIATSPSAYGETVVMRLLNQSNGLLSLDRLGLPPAAHALFRESLDKPQGMILVTGPTGSGKTTTLYAALAEVNSGASKIITVEDPIEYRIDGLIQIQTHDKIGLNFSKALRSILRQDPDIVLIGELRDAETVESALRASLTGHLVLSTLHTNDAKGAIARLSDMGAMPYMIASSLRMVIAQRLLRLVCDRCKISYQPDANEIAWLNAALAQKPDVLKTAQYIRGKGCQRCVGTGWWGRAGVYEVLAFDRNLTLALQSGGPAAFEKEATRILGGDTLGAHAAELAASGLTTPHEARRVSYE